MSAHRSSPRLVVLHALRCVGASGTDRLARAARLPAGDVESELIDLAVEGLVGRSAGPFGAWSLTASGRETDAAAVAAELEASGTAGAVREAFDAFVALNKDVLAACTDWQLRPLGTSATRNDHTDHAHDDAVLRRLGILDARAQPVCAALAGALTRFAPYGARLTDALARARSGENSAVTDDLESYHVVWFQLHEDLLATLAIPRGWA